MHKIALQGVNVEVDDEDETDELFFGGKSPAPALSDAYDEEESGEPAPALSGESMPETDEIVMEDTIDGSPEKIVDSPASSNIMENNLKSGLDFSKLDRDVVLQGVDVETEADDDSDEEALPLMGGELAPALAANDETSIYNASIFDKSSAENVEEEIAGTLGGFFDEEIAAHLSPVTKEEDEDNLVASLQVDSSDEKKIGDISVNDTAAGDFDTFSAAGQQEDIAALDERLASFFDLKEEVVSPEEDALLHKEPDTTEDSIAADEQVAPPVFDAIEEEVVFELVEEETDLVETGYGPYQALQSCVDALGIELDEKIIVSLWQEINSLYKNLSDKPLEKTFLQLLSTVTRHIDRNRFDSTTDAYVLLQSVCTALTTLQEDNLHHNQEILLTETQKVLNWQEQILQRLAGGNEAE